ncbi:hypothetical protein LshimejAT787_0201220 [Lyophyllum shimeji]|uniref:Uncharacterized protein n=1 Tax=Lyophyllum shimeji TaxID=47721 RepID=A0A9P3UIR4_LYOSH|nr:hypothetical protein LshimejAT787_0201220 [Lyophyllum shimeji]
MPQSSIYAGTKTLLHEISLGAIQPDLSLPVSPKDLSFPTSYDLGPTRLVVPGSPPAWTPQDLPIVLPADSPAVDPRTVLPSCPLDALFRAIQITSPDLALDEFDLITDRKNLRALFDFIQNKKGDPHRIEAELVGGTLLFYLGWSASSYTNFPNRPTYGMNFERMFTGPLSEGTIQHNRVVTYVFGGLKVMVKYQADACLVSASPAVSTPPQRVPSAADVTPFGLHVITSGSLVPLRP